jgi:hypothetical protein
VRRFRERTEERLATLDRLHEAMPAEVFEEHFSPKFMEKVESKRDEWIDALRDLEAACEAYARPAGEPVEAHLYDLFPYYIDKIAGSTHYSAAGILFLNYYFKKGQTLAENVEEGDELSEPERLIVELARKTGRDAELGREIEDACEQLAGRIPSDWKTRALREVRAKGYQPVKKHGVAINITPLAETEIVPELVDDKVL